MAVTINHSGWQWGRAPSLGHAVIRIFTSEEILRCFTATFGCEQDCIGPTENIKAFFNIHGMSDRLIKESSQM
jgi:hypothetical protein